jgi:hypothetical protein
MLHLAIMSPRQAWPEAPAGRRRALGNPRRPGAVLIATSVLGFAALGVAPAAGGHRRPVAGVARTRCPARAGAQAARLVKGAKHRWNLERWGSATHAALRRIAADRRLIHALGIGDLPAVRKETERQLVLHVVRIRIVNGIETLVDANPTSFAVAGSARALRSRSGKFLGKLEVSIQDVVGFIKLVHKYVGGEVVVRGQRGQARTSLASVPNALPRSACARIAGVRYVVRAFSEKSFSGEPLTIYVLGRA